MKKQEAIMPDLPKRIVIVGGGFAGVTLAQRLERLLPAQMEIVVLSAENHLVFTPMLPEVVGRTISPLHVVVAGRQLTRRTQWLEARVSRIDRENNEAHYVRRDGTAASMRYTHLVLACGSAANLEEIPGLASRGYPLKTVIDAIVMGNDLIGNFEAAATEPEPEVRQRLLTVVVIGGGFSGVEVAGHIADLMQAIRRFYPELKNETPSHRSVAERRAPSAGVESRIVIQVYVAETPAKRNRSAAANSGPEGRLRRGASDFWRADRDGNDCLHGGHGDASADQGPGSPAGKRPTEDRPGHEGEGHRPISGHSATVRLSPTPTMAGRAPRPRSSRCSRPGSWRRILSAPREAPRRSHFIFIREACSPRLAIATLWRSFMASSYPASSPGFYGGESTLSKLPTLSRKLEVAMSWACSIPFPPNIVQLRLSKMQLPDAGIQSHASTAYRRD